MKMRPLRLLLTAVISTMLVAGSMAVPASAGSPYKQWPTGWSNGSNHPGAYQYGSAEQVRYDKKWKKSYKSSNAHKFRAPKKYSYKSYKSYKPRKFRRHDDNFVIGLGLGFLGAAILSAPYYQASGDWCHVHRYPVRGMTFHTDVRCFKHRNWNSPSILYVR